LIQAIVGTVPLLKAAIASLVGLRIFPSQYKTLNIRSVAEFLVTSRFDHVARAGIAIRYPESIGT
jgi:hypothetical protein